MPTPEEEKEAARMAQMHIKMMADMMSSVASTTKLNLELGEQVKQINERLTVIQVRVAKIAEYLPTASEENDD